MGTSISTNGNPATESVRYADDPYNPHIVFRNNNRGYVRCTLTPETLDERVPKGVDGHERGGIGLHAGDLRDPERARGR